ncbi:MAG: hypothetical protein H6702_20330 [Myxococcales bacterium]|nr:hypothetical protein [Myxococcales bacterium]
MAEPKTSTRWVRWLLLLDVLLAVAGGGFVFRGCAADDALDDSGHRLVQEVHTLKAGEVATHALTAKPQGAYQMTVVQRTKAPFTGALAFIPQRLEPGGRWTPQAVAAAWPKAKMVWHPFQTSRRDAWEDGAKTSVIVPADGPTALTAWYAQTDGPGTVEIIVDESTLTPTLRRQLEDERLWSWLPGAVLLFTCLMIGLWTMALWSDAV